MKPEEFEVVKENFKQEFKKFFPKGYINVREENRFSDTIIISFGLLGDHSICGNIIENDPMLHTFFINVDNENELEKVRGNLKVKPTSRYYAMDNVKVPYRKVKGDLNKIQKHFGKYLDKLKKEVIKQGDNIYKSDVYHEYLQF